MSEENWNERLADIAWERWKEEYAERRWKWQKQAIRFNLPVKVTFS